MNGVLYAAVGERYLRAAEISARSVRRTNPTVRLAIATAGTAPGVFDTVLPLREDDGYRAKIVAMLSTPFARTLMLDADTYVAGDVSDLFGLLDRFDIALAHAPNRVVLPLDDVPEAFPELNTGVIAFRRSRRVKRLLRRWLREYERLQPMAPRSKDQPSFRRVAYTSSRVRLATLPPELNLRFRMGGSHNRPVRILHGWAEERVYEHVVALLNGRVEGWGHSAVFAGGKLFDRTGEVVGELRPPPAGT